MKLLVVGLLVGVFSVGCASRPVARPFVAQSLKKKEVVKKEEKNEVELKKPEVPTARKAFAGKVTFQGLTEGQLASIQVVPEEGALLFKPENKSYDQVDGFWWQGSAKGEWFKIPDWSEVWVGASPENFDATAHRGDLKIYLRERSLISVVGGLSGKVTRPSWVPDSGKTRAPARPSTGFLQ